MSGFEPSLVIVGAETRNNPPEGHARLLASINAHLGDLPRVGINELAACDVCGSRDGAEVDRAGLKPGVAAWIQVLCPRCEWRLEVGRRAGLKAEGFSDFLPPAA